MSRLDYLLLLRTIKDEVAPVGAVFLSKKLEIPSATIGRLLKTAEDEGYVTSVSNKGRILTEKGVAYLQSLDAAEEKKKIAEELIDTTMNSDEALIEILKVRLLIEPYTVAKACERATEDDLTELEEYNFEQMISIRRGGLGNEADLNYHMKLAELSGNKTIVRILRLLLTENNVYTTFSYLSSAMHLQQLTAHTDITAAVKERDQEKAKQAMKGHLELLIDNTKKYLEMKEKGELEE